jgi:cobalamin biosynthesis protein CobD/CbiB
LGAALFAGAGALVWAFAGYCEDSCDPPPSRTTGLIVAVVFFLIAVGVGVGATLLWRRLQRARMRSEASTSWAALMAPALAAWLAVPIWVVGS